MPTINLGKRKKHHDTAPRNYNTPSRIQRQAIYNTPEWKKLRKAYLMAHPLCEECLKNGKTTPAEQVHHITSFMNYTDMNQRIQAALDWDNLEAICQECHNKIHNKKGRKN